MRSGLVSAALLATACGVSVPVPQARVKLGPARGAALKKVLALPTRCVAADPSLCNDAQAVAVDSSARMTLEFAGARLVDSEVVNAYLARRVTTETDGHRREVVEDQETWETASDETRRQLLIDLGVDGYLTSEINVGRAKNLDDQRTLSVKISIIRARDLASAWTSRCSVETGRYYLDDEAVELATRCALESALMVGL